MKRVIGPLSVVVLLAGCSAAPRKPATLDLPKPQPAPVSAPAAPAPAPRLPINGLMPIETRPIIAPAPVAPAPAPAVVVPEPVYVVPEPAPAEYTPAPAAPVPYVVPEPVYYEPPVEDGTCAKPTDRGETDGGYGGTGLAPEDCPPQI